MIDNPQPGIVNVGVGLCPSFMGTFDYLPPTGNFHYMTIVPDQPWAEFFQISSFHTTYFHNLWTLPSPSAMMEGTEHHGMAMPLSMAKVSYLIIQQASVDPDPTPTQELYTVLKPIWAQGSLTDTDSLDLALPSYEVIIEAMTSPYRPWDDLHHRSYFLAELRQIEAGEFTLTMNRDKDCLINPLATHVVYAEGNMEKIAEMIPIDISRTPGFVENIFVRANCSLEEIQAYTNLFKEFHDIFAWSYEEMPGINPRIVEHEITTYPDVKSVRQKLRLINPRKETVIKVEVEKLLKVGFIYPIQLTQWVSNLMPANKKQGMIHVCMDFHDLNKACPKDNFPTPFIDHIVDECTGCQAFSFMDGFSRYNQIQIKPKDQHKTTFICPWGTFSYPKMPFRLKNVRPTFQPAMYFSFHELKHIVEAYLNDLASRSRKRVDHPKHL
jgi:hypothetical protein